MHGSDRIVASAVLRPGDSTEVTFLTRKTAIFICRILPPSGDSDRIQAISADHLRMYRRKRVSLGSSEEFFIRLVVFACVIYGFTQIWRKNRRERDSKHDTPAYLAQEPDRDSELVSSTTGPLSDHPDRPDPSAHPAPAASPAPPPRQPLPQLPFKLRWRQRLIRWRQSRTLAYYEFQHHHDSTTESIKIRFFQDRRPYRLDLQMTNAAEVGVENIWFATADNHPAMPFGVNLRSTGESLQCTIQLVPDTPVREVTIQLSGYTESLESTLSVAAVADARPDYDLLKTAFEAAEQRDYKESLRQFRGYLQLSRKNPHVFHAMSLVLRQLGKLDQAEACAITAATMGLGEAAMNQYHQIRQEHDLETPLEKIRELQESSAEWQLPKHHGAIVLLRHQQIVLGLGQGHLRRRREIYVINRRAAARRMRRLAFDFEASHEYFVHSALRIIHADGEIEIVPLDHLTVGEAESENPFITTESRRLASWILPDLDVGDVIEWSNELVCMDRMYDEEPHPFLLLSLVSEYLPTHRGRIECVLPDDYQVDFQVLNGGQGQVEVIDKREGIHIAQVSNFIPARLTGFVYESYFLDPLVACARSGKSWRDIADKSLQTLIGSNIAADTFPDSLASMLFTDDATSSLANTFYWLRDRFKYGSFHAGTKRIGQKDRANQLLTAGIGDCKDMTYLLALACRQLDIPHDVLAISTQHGLAVKELPADQFDHVFLRARPTDAWLYLDAASNSAIFSNPPAWCQGMDAFVVGGQGEFVTIPVDAPEQNKIAIRERWTRMDDGWLEDEIDLTVAGIAARDFEEHWKTFSLTLNRDQRAAEEACRMLLPSIVLQTWERTAETSHSDQLHLSALGSRGPLIQLGNRLVANLHWRLPYLPLEHWRQLELDRLFVFMVPMSLEIELTIADDLHRRLDDVSRVERLDSDVCLVEEELQRSAHATTLCRRIIIKQKYVRDGAVARLPEAFERIESALNAVLAFNDRQER